MKKLDDLIKRAKALTNPALFRVIFKDGTIQTYHAAQVIPLFLKGGKEIARIEHDEQDTKNGLLPLLFSSRHTYDPVWQWLLLSPASPHCIRCSGSTAILQLCMLRPCLQ